MDTEIYSYDNDQIQKIDTIEFGVWGNQEIERASALGKGTPGINIPDLYDNQDPKRGGLIDPLMGTTDDSIICHTCGLNNISCPGHFGHITLAEPVFHMGYLPFVKKILSCICLKCSKLLIYKNEQEITDMLKYKTGKSRLNELRNIVKNVTYCQKTDYGCGAPVTKIRYEVKKSTGAITMYSDINLANLPKEERQGFEGKKKTSQVLTPDMVYDKLKNISDVHCEMMGLKTRPEMMVHKIFPVPPVPVRPSVQQDFAGTMEDDLTHKLADIVKANIRIARHKEKDSDNTSKFSQDYLHLLQYHIAYYQGNEFNLPNSEQKGKVTRSLGPRLKGKEGRVRGNLEGKRVDFSARTVITSDPTISINQLGVPIKIAMNLTFPEIVTPDNIETLKTYVRNGRDKYPGANFVFPLSEMEPGQRILPIDLRFNKDVELHFGDIVERHLLDDDIVLLNRQPTLHKLSMMGHRVKVINNPNYNTFRLSVAVTTPYNADFDGDEMNIFLSQSIQTQIELEEIADVKRQIITPATSRTIIGIVQDGLIGAYNLTSPAMRIDWKNAMNIMSYTSIDNFSAFKKGKEYTGHEIFSMIIPPKINVSKGDLLIKNGVLERGFLGKSLLGPKGKNNLTQLIWDEYGVDQTQKFLDNTQRLINNFNLYNGFTVGIGDVYIAPDVEQQIATIFETKDVKVAHMVTELENNTDLMPLDLFERSLFAELNVIREDISKLVMANLSPTNNFNIMITSGSKGDQSNMCQISGCVGLQASQGTLQPKRTNKRSLVYFHRDDDSSTARGLIKRSFTKGITYPEFFFLNISGRDGLIDSAVKTAESGYIQRKLVKALEDAQLVYDCTVRTASNGILQFIYGDTGADTSKQYEYPLKILEMNNSDIAAKHKFTKDELKNVDWDEKSNDAFYRTVLEIRDILQISQVKTRMNYITLNTIYMLPVNLNRIIDNAKNSSDSSDKSQLSPAYILDKINWILDNHNTQLQTIRPSDLDNPKSVKNMDSQVAKTSLRAALYDCLSPKRVIFEYKIGKLQFDAMVEEIIDSYNKNMAEPSEMVGIIAAQSAGEPTTQMTLKSFHTAGISAISTTTQGVPRIKELLSLTRNLKTPQMIVYLTKEYMETREMANKIASYMTYTTLGDLRNKLQVIYDPDPYRKGGPMEVDNVTKVFTSKGSQRYSCQSDINGLNWLIRIEFSRESLFNKEVTLLDIKSKFCNLWEKRHSDKTLKKEEKNVFEKITHIAIMSNTDYDNIPIVHIRFSMDGDELDIHILNDFIDHVIDKFKLKGIPSITNIDAVNEERVLSFDNPEHEIEKKKQYVIYTAGTNLYDIRYINGIDIYKTICNDVIAMYETFGIEAARATLLREIIYAYERGGSNVNYHHISILIDLMTFNGYMVSIDRHGMNKTDVGPLSRASFEKTVDQLQTAAVFSEIDNMNGVSSRIMAGLVIKGGTGLCNIILDTDMIQKSQFTEDISQKYIKTFNNISENNFMKDIIKTTNQEPEELGMFIPE